MKVLSQLASGAVKMSCTIPAASRCVLTVLVLTMFLVSRLLAGDGTAVPAKDDAPKDEGAVEPIAFFHALTNKPLEFKYRVDQELTPAVEQFYVTGVNPYAGQQEFVDAGLKVYKKLCQACHLKDGKGRIGPNLTDETWTRKRTDTDIGRFEIIYGGGAGAMQAFGRRMDQDDILKVMAFIDTLREK